jgi:hypothetical protein
MASQTNPELYTIYAEIIRSEQILYRNFLRLLFSADYVETPGFVEIPDDKGQMQRIPNPHTETLKLPSARKTCPHCHVISTDEGWEYCAHTDAKNVTTTYQTKYLDWKPLFNTDGFNKIISSILAATDEIMSTGNINVDDKKSEQVSLKNLAFEKVLAINEVITENTYDWSATGAPNISDGLYYLLDCELFDHFFFVTSRSRGAYLLNGMQTTSKVEFKNPSQGGSYNESPRGEKKGLGEIFFGR